MATAHSVTISRGALDAVRRGHPWVYREQLGKLVGSPKTGDEVAILDGSEVIARGLYDASSALALRVWTRSAPISGPLFETRVKRALAKRDALFDDRTTAYRWIHGEGDRMPGVVVDRYASVAVLRLDGDAIMSRLDMIVAALWPAARSRGVRSLLLRKTEKADTEKTTLLEGEEVTSDCVVREHGVSFIVDVLRGQKTGAFLDQRDNRQRVGALARGKSVLNLFSYAGGFSLHAALGGATRVTSVDVAANAHATAQASFRVAGVDPAKHAFVTSDAYVFLDSAKRRNERWDLIVSDPPSFAPSEKAVPRALAAYRKLHRACVDVLAEGGGFCASSCSSHIGAARFLQTLDDASLGRDDLSLSAMVGHPDDHPTLPAWPEGAYLKFAVLR